MATQPGELTTSRAWVQRQTSARIADILDAAITILVEEGYAQFSMRKVAAAVGVGLATVQHHFANRENLLTAATLKVVRAWAAELAPILENSSRSVEDRLFDLHERGLRYIEDEPDTSPLLFELFAAAQHEPFLLSIVRDMYLTLRTEIAALLGELRPDLTHDELMAFATIVPAQMEGLNVFMQNADPNRPDGELMRRVLRSSVQGLVEAVKAY